MWLQSTGATEVGIATTPAGGNLVLTNGTRLNEQARVWTIGAATFSPPDNSQMILRGGSYANLSGSIRGHSGSLVVESGSTLAASSITPVGSTLDNFRTIVRGSGSSADFSVQILAGVNGHGTVEVDDSAALTASVPMASNAFQLAVGVYIGSTGAASINGGSTVELTSNLAVAQSGFASMTIAGGSVVRSRANPLSSLYPAIATVIGQRDNGVGIVSIQGSGSKLDSLGQLRVGLEAFASGTLSVSDHALASAHSTYVATSNTARGTIVVSDAGRLNAGTTLVIGNLSTSGGVRAALELYDGGVAICEAEARVNPAGTLSIAGGQFDLGRGALLIDYAASDPITNFTNHVREGYDGGGWLGKGIVTTATPTEGLRGIAIVPGTYWPSFFFAGQFVDSTSLLLRATLMGDADANRMVDISDFALLAANFNQPGTWLSGDFDYSQTVNIADFALLAGNFGRSYSLTADRGSAVPEPVLSGVIPLMAWALRRRCR